MENNPNAIADVKRRVCIVGGGIIGLSTAYYLAKRNRYVITVIEKDSTIDGASARNAGTITLSSFSPWTTVNMWGIIRENLFMKKERTAYLKFSLIFDSDFR